MGKNGRKVNEAPSGSLPPNQQLKQEKDLNGLQVNRMDVQKEPCAGGGGREALAFRAAWTGAEFDRRSRGKQDEMESKSELVGVMSARAIRCRGEPSEAMLWWGKEIAAQRDSELQWLTKERKYRSLSTGWWWGGGLRDFGEMSTVSVVLPADHGSRAVTDGGTEYRMSADTKQTQPGDVKCFSCCFRQDEEGPDWSCTKKKEKKKTTGQICLVWNFCLLKEGKDIGRFCWLQQEESAPCVQGQHVCVEAQTHSGLTQSLESLPHQPQPVVRKPRWCETCFLWTQAHVTGRGSLGVICVFVKNCIGLAALWWVDLDKTGTSVDVATVQHQQQEKQACRATYKCSLTWALV